MRKVEKRKLKGHKGQRENIKKREAHSLIHSCLFAILILRALELQASLGRNPKRR